MRTEIEVGGVMGSDDFNRFKELCEDHNATNFFVDGLNGHLNIVGDMYNEDVDAIVDYLVPLGIGFDSFRESEDSLYEASGRKFRSGMDSVKEYSIIDGDPYVSMPRIQAIIQYAEDNKASAEDLILELKKLISLGYIPALPPFKVED